MASDSPVEERPPASESGAELELRLGEGWISGYLSALLGLCSLGGVLCFAYPELLTTGDLRETYDPALLRQLIYWGIVAAVLSAALNFLFRFGRKQAFVGFASAVAATALGGPFVETDGAPAGGLALGLDYLILGLLVSALVFIPIEKLFAKNRRQPVLRREWDVDLEYFALSHLLVSYILLVSVNAVPSLFAWAVLEPLQTFVRGLPGWTQFFAIVVVADLAQYTIHRFYHRNPAFWGLHAIHHSARVLDWLAGSRQHLLEIVITRAVVFCPIFLLGFSENAIAAYVVLVGLQAVFAHANVGIDFGALNYLVVTPQVHHWHHSDDPAAADTNFAVHTPIIDMLFGTFRLPKSEWPESYGVIGEAVPPTLWRQLIWPFRRGKRLRATR